MLILSIYYRYQTAGIFLPSGVDFFLETDPPIVLFYRFGSTLCALVSSERKTKSNLRLRTRHCLGSTKSLKAIDQVLLSGRAPTACKSKHSIDFWLELYHRTLVPLQVLSVCCKKFAVRGGKPKPLGYREGPLTRDVLVA